MPYEVYAHIEPADGTYDTTIWYLGTEAILMNARMLVSKFVQAGKDAGAEPVEGIATIYSNTDRSGEAPQMHVVRFSRRGIGLAFHIGPIVQETVDASRTYSEGEFWPKSA